MRQLPENGNDKSGAILLVIGVVLCGWLVYVHATGGRVWDILIFIPPYLVLVGAATMVWPQQMSSMHNRRNIGSWHPIAIAVLVLGIAAGFALRYSFFADWR